MLIWSFPRIWVPGRSSNRDMKWDCASKNQEAVPCAISWYCGRWRYETKALQYNFLARIHFVIVLFFSWWRTTGFFLHFNKRTFSVKHFIARIGFTVRFYDLENKTFDDMYSYDTIKPNPLLSPYNPTCVWIQTSRHYVLLHHRGGGWKGTEGVKLVTALRL